MNGKEFLLEMEGVTSGIRFDRNIPGKRRQSKMNESTRWPYLQILFPNRVYLPE